MKPFKRCNIIVFVLFVTCCVFSQQVSPILWKPAGLENHTIVDIQATEENGILAATKDCIFRTIDNGLNWAKVDSGYPDILSFSESVNDTIMVWSGRPDTLMCSYDNGLNWRSTNFVDETAFSMNTCGGALYVGTFNKVLKSSDGGNTWTTLVKASDFGYYSSISISEMGVLSIKNNSNNHLYITLRGDFENGTVTYSGLFHSVNGGETWVELTKNLEEKGSWEDVLIDEKGNIYLGANYFCCGNAEGLYRSKDGGQSWHQVLECKNISEIIKNSLGIIIANTRCGIMISSDDGNTWTLISEGIDDLFVKSVTTNNAGFIFAATSEGVYKFDLNEYVTTSITTQTIAPDDFSLYQNYPNPFNPETTIKYELPKTSHVEINIYNLYGQKVVNLISKVQNVGTHLVIWNASGLASGIYYYRLSAGEFSRSSKMVLLK